MPTSYWNKIEKYWYFWFVDKPGGRICLKLAGGSTTHINIDNDIRLQGIADTLRNEKPCYWNVTYTSIGPFWEEVGEEES